MAHAPRPSVVILRRVVLGLLAVALLSSCSSGSTAGAPSTSLAETTEDTSAAVMKERTAQLRWACPSEARLRAFTDPLIYPARLTLRQVLDRVYPDGTDMLVQSNDGRLAFVLDLDGQQQIERRVRFERSTSVGWHVEVVLFCRQRSLR